MVGRPELDRIKTVEVEVDELVVFCLGLGENNMFKSNFVIDPH